MFDYSNFMIIFSIFSYRVETDGSLYMYNITKDDEGMYECSAQNHIGFVAARAVLTVQGN